MKIYRYILHNLDLKYARRNECVIFYISWNTQIKSISKRHIFVETIHFYPSELSNFQRYFHKHTELSFEYNACRCVTSPALQNFIHLYCLFQKLNMELRKMMLNNLNIYFVSHDLFVWMRKYEKYLICWLQCCIEA